AKAYVEARKEHGQSQLLDEIESSKPQVDRHGAHSPEELKATGLQHLRDAIALLDAKATPDEVAAYRRFVLSVADRVAQAHREDGMDVSGPEQAAMDEITAAMGGS